MFLSGFPMMGIVLLSIIKQVTYSFQEGLHFIQGEVIAIYSSHTTKEICEAKLMLISYEVTNHFKMQVELSKQNEA